MLLSRDLRNFIARMPNLEGHEWEGKAELEEPAWQPGDKTLIKNLKKEIKECLKELQGDFCAYCGMSFYVTSSTQIEHIAPKGNGRYPQFMFHVSNLVHACTYCNGFEKKEKAAYFNTIGILQTDYEQCPFNIVHPYLDDPDQHYDFTQAGVKVLINHKTLKGQKSITVFKLDDEPLTTERGKSVLINRYKVDPIFQNDFAAAITRRGY